MLEKHLQRLESTIQAERLDHENAVRGLVREVDNLVGLVSESGDDGHIPQPFSRSQDSPDAMLADVKVWFSCLRAEISILKALLPLNVTLSGSVSESGDDGHIPQPFSRSQDSPDAMLADVKVWFSCLRSEISILKALLPLNVTLSGSVSESGDDGHIPQPFSRSQDSPDAMLADVKVWFSCLRSEISILKALLPLNVTLSGSVSESGDDSHIPQPFSRSQDSPDAMLADVKVWFSCLRSEISILKALLPLNVTLSGSVSESGDDGHIPQPFSRSQDSPDAMLSDVKVWFSCLCA